MSQETRGGLREPARISRRDDWPADSVVHALAESGLTVDVIIPARNEQSTIADIVTELGTIRGSLIQEILVVDSRSTDRTAERAAAAGARVIGLGEVMAHVPPRAGKGEAMWRGLAATTSDLVVFIDGDLLDFDASLVSALVGPLVADENLSLVKGSYERPGSDPDRPLAAGGRVTELMARPLIGAFWPALAGIVQPLGGEYSARRAVLESVPFRCGYGVELGLLVDTARQYGAESIGQVDLGTRRHRNAELSALGRMAAEVLHTAIDRLEDEGRLGDLDRSAIIHQPVRADDGYVHDLATIDTGERPPLRDLRAALDLGEAATS